LHTCQFRQTIQFVRHIRYGSLWGKEVVLLSNEHYCSLLIVAKLNQTKYVEYGTVSYNKDVPECFLNVMYEVTSDLEVA
jgi:hypothetical protein